MTQNSMGNALVDGLGLLALLVAYFPGSPGAQGKPHPIGYVSVSYKGGKCQVCMALTNDREIYLYEVRNE
ncbi:hypothetical protein N7453_009426 [Penicillium expansum]|nr:hypothetical protein N7453_009426 [Penicillium expansum]